MGFKLIKGRSIKVLEESAGDGDGKQFEADSKTYSDYMYTQHKGHNGHESKFLDNHEGKFDSLFEETGEIYHGEEGFQADDGLSQSRWDDDEEIYDIIDTIVPRTDNIMMPVLTLRVLVIGTMLTVVMSVINTIFSFRANSFVCTSPSSCITK
jgi:hypothetical protein